MFYKKDFGGWDQCRVGGTTRFEDPRIGKFEYVDYKEQQTCCVPRTIFREASLTSCTEFNSGPATASRDRDLRNQSSA